VTSPPVTSPVFPSNEPKTTSIFPKTNAEVVVTTNSPPSRSTPRSTHLDKPWLVNVAPNPCNKHDLLDECTDVSPCDACKTLLKSSVGKCRECELDVGGFHSCPHCRSRMHGYCGVGTGDETSTQLRICRFCAEVQSTPQPRKRTRQPPGRYRSS
jgi:hypothetical protein